MTTKAIYNKIEKLRRLAHYFSVEVIAKKYDPFNERVLEKVAKQCNGKETGAGLGVERDISYQFYDLKDIKRFLKLIKKDIKSSKTQVSKITLDWNYLDGQKVKL